MQHDVAPLIGYSLAPITLTNPWPPRSPYSMMKPSFGTTLSPWSGQKLSRRSKLDTELDFYLDFLCRKPKLKWSSTKFNYRQSQAETLLQPDYTSSSTATNESSHTIGTTMPGPQISLPHIPALSIPLPISLSQSPSQIPREETPNTWTVLWSWTPPQFFTIFCHLFCTLGHSFPTCSLTHRSDRHQITWQVTWWITWSFRSQLSHAITLQYHHLTLYGLPAHDVLFLDCQLMMELYLELPCHDASY